MRGKEKGEEMEPGSHRVGNPFGTRVSQLPAVQAARVVTVCCPVHQTNLIGVGRWDTLLKPASRPTRLLTNN